MVPHVCARLNGVFLMAHKEPPRVKMIRELREILAAEVAGKTSQGATDTLLRAKLLEYERAMK